MLLNRLATRPIIFNIYVSGKLPLKSNTATTDFKRGNFPSMKGLARTKLKKGESEGSELFRMQESYLKL